MNSNDFHIPFIKSLLIVAVVTLVSMGTARYFINNSFSSTLNTPNFTSLKSHTSPESP